MSNCVLQFIIEQYRSYRILFERMALLIDQQPHLFEFFLENPVFYSRNNDYNQAYNE